MGVRRIDWSSAKAEYIATRSITLEEIAKKYGTTKNYAQNVAQKESWVKEKEERWSKAEKDAIDEVEGGLKDLIIRHAKVARYMQAAGTKYVKFLLDEIEEQLASGNKDEARKALKSLMHNKVITGSNLIKMVSEGLKAERELYPKQMQIKADMSITDSGMSDELEQAIYESFRSKLGRKKPSIHNGVSQKSKGKK